MGNVKIESGQKWKNHDSGYVVEVEKVGHDKVTVKRVAKGMGEQTIRTQIARKRFGLTTKKGLTLLIEEAKTEGGAESPASADAEPAPPVSEGASEHDGQSAVS